MPDPADDPNGTREPGADRTAAGDLVDVVASLLEADPDQREALLARLPAPDADLARARLTALGALGLSLDEPASVLGLPRRLGRFVRLERVGAGGMGEVHLARDDATGELAAIKLLRPEHLWFEAAHARFRRELRSLAPLAHEGIVRVLEVGEEQGVPWLALEWVGGVSLEQVLDRLRGLPPDTLQPSDFEEAVRDACAGRIHSEPSRPRAFPGRTYVEVVARVALRVAEALAHAHAAGVLHRDVKPSNVLVTPSGRVLLVDFGLALPRGVDRITRAGSWLGSLPYAAPEQVDGESHEVDERVDVYGLGALLYELITLRTPFLGGPEQQIRRRIATGDLESPRRLNRRIPTAIEAVCLAAVDPDVERRPAGAREMAEDLESALTGRPVRSRPPPLSLRMRRWVRRHPGRAAVIAGLAAVVALVTAFSAREVSVARQIARLADTELVRGLIEERDEFWPADRARISALERWLSRAAQVLDNRPDHEAELASLRELALPETPEEWTLARSSSLERLGTLLREMDALRSYIARTGKGVQPAPPDPDWVESRDREIRALLHGPVEQLRPEIEAEIARLRDAAREDPGAWSRDTDQIDSFETLSQQILHDLEVHPPPRFAEPLDAWRHHALRRLLEDFDRLEALVARVRHQLDETRRLDSLFEDEAGEDWRRAIEAVASSPLYAGLRLEPVFGLQPLGADPRSGLHEFLLVTSGDAPTRDPQAPRGCRVEPETGIVLVLVPGGRFDMGQPRDSGREVPNASPVHPIVLDPFLIAKFELTCGQAARLGYAPPLPLRRGGDRAPVPIDWNRARDLLREHGLEIPTEAQWEYAARGGQSGPWPLEGHANIGDLALAEAWKVQGFRMGNSVALFDDAFVDSAPVGSFQPNGFGLHDTLGNVAEWCLDPFIFRGYSSLIPRAGDGLRDSAFAEGDRVVRGGSFVEGPERAQVWARYRHTPSRLDEALGVRPVMRIVGR